MNRRVRIVALLASLLACSPRQPAPGASTEREPCTAVSGGLAPDASADGLQGVYHLQLVASSGARAGASTSAELELVPADDSLRSPPAALGLSDSTARYPLVGWTALDPAAVGGTDTGALDSHDPASPGVLVIERRTAQADGPMNIMLRLGAEANRPDQVRFDGGYFALTVRRIDDGGFAGTWASAAAGPAAKGYFCAARAAR